MILVAGGSGMLGAALRKRLGKDFRGISKRGLAGCEAADLADEAAVKALFAARYEYVVHAAAMSDVDGCERSPMEAHAANALTTRHLARACAESGTPFVYVSTDYVFDGKKRSPYETGDPTGPINVYGLTKLEGEFYAKACPRSAVVRTSWLFGPGNPRNFVDAIKSRLLAGGDVPVLADQTDSPTYTEDLAAAIAKIGAHLAGDEADRRLTLHFCNKGETTRFEMTNRIRECLGARGARVVRAETIPDRPALRPEYAVLRTADYEKLFGETIRGWEDGLKDYLRDAGAACAS